ncbi:protein JINGUBANG-like [Silene latifolia]|uniref:protein JINGUBANG-like n=1 Tax=Silene latifolia TaxID=37657 RepID=UPI003D76AFF0
MTENLCSSSHSNSNIFNSQLSNNNDVDVSDKKPLPTLFDDDDDEETKDIAPSFHHLSLNNYNSPSLRYHHDIISSPSHHETNLSPDSSPLVPRSPESKWTPSPPSTPSPPLLYRCISSLRHEGSIFSIVVSRGLVFTGSSSTYIRAWQPLDCREKGYIQTSSGKVRAMLAHGGMLFTAHKDHKIRVWNIISHNAIFRPKKIATLPKLSPLRFLISWASHSSALQHKDTISCMAFNHADGILYTGSWDKTVKAWSLNDRKCIDSFAAHADNINDMVINHDGFIFTCSSDGTVKMWNKVSGENFHTLTMTLTFHSYPIYALVLSDASQSERSLLYAGSSDGCINVYEQQISGRYNHEGSIQGHQFAVLCLTMLDNLVISGSEDAMIKIWRRGEGRIYECLAVLEGHKGPIKCLGACLEKDNMVMGFLVFSASSDRTFKVWRVKVFSQEMRGRNQSLDIGDDYDNSINVLSSPALSPSWVEMKLRLSTS